MKLPLRYAAIAISAVSFSGAALADSSASALGPDSSNYLDQSSRTSVSQSNTNVVGVSNTNSQSAASGSVSAGGNTGSGYGYGSGWASYDPQAWKDSGRSFNDWWGAVNGSYSQYGQGWNGSNAGWQPTSQNWQSQWSNWDPQLWQSNGSSYNNWLSTILPYMLMHRTDFMTGWGGSGSGNTSVGSLASGAANNDNATTTSVMLNNGGNGGGSAAMLAALMPATSNVTANAVGPDSSNVVRLNNDFRYDQTNYNSVGVTNSNNQSARSGDVSANRNTEVGGLTSGDAMNRNQTATMVDLQN